MNVLLNNNSVSTTACTLQQLADELQWPAAGVAVAVDNQHVPRKAWAEKELTEGCRVTLVRAACGG